MIKPVRMSEERRLRLRIPYGAGHFVYLIERGGVVVYVGETANIRSRVACHAKALPSDRIEYAPVSKDRAGEIEEALIHRLKPSANERKVPPLLTTDANITIRMPLALLRSVTILAAKEERSRNQYILRTLREKVEAGE